MTILDSLIAEPVPLRLDEGGVRHRLLPLASERSRRIPVAGTIRLGRVRNWRSYNLLFWDTGASPSSRSYPPAFPRTNDRISIASTKVVTTTKIMSRSTMKVTIDTATRITGVAMSSNRPAIMIASPRK